VGAAIRASHNDPLVLPNGFQRRELRISEVGLDLSKHRPHASTPNLSAKPRVAETLGDATRNGLWSLISSRMDDEWFGYAFPARCADGYAHAGTDRDKLEKAMLGYQLPWPQNTNPPNKQGPLFDVLEFAYEHIAEAKDPKYHQYMGHTHYIYDQEAGRAKFEEDVNRIFERNGAAFEMKHGEVTRIAPTGLQQALAETVFRASDMALDEMLETARQKFLDHSLDVRRVYNVTRLGVRLDQTMIGGCDERFAPTWWVEFLWRLHDPGRGRGFGSCCFTQPSLDDVQHGAAIEGLFKAAHSLRLAEA